jgi:hypothetical protein
MDARALYLFIVLLAIVSGATLYQYLGLEDKDSYPRIEITPASYDFGDVPYQEVEAILLIKNVGDEDLEINGISTSCGCTKAYAKEKVIKPGGKTELIVTFDPNLMEYEVFGEIYRAVFVTSNDPVNEEITIEIVANVVKKGLPEGIQ